ncbi:hypothetical protein VZ95_16815 [Elstera litoralis]|uniref:Uncharacterized protein n=2 Tax=Elstera litoralis TaxID=552518 RepID=A0A0F3IPQ5_9PROT|nr:hypothetical protein VZ95_16815 [Elstera litoralis]
MLIAVFVCTPIKANEISFGMREVAPYVMKTETGVSGLDYEIIAAALAQKGHSLSVKLYPFARLVATFDANPAIEAAAPVISSFPVTGWLSEPFITYRNIALSLAPANLSVNTIADLARFQIIAFQNARNALGAEFAAAVAHNSRYREESSQQLAVRILFNGRTDLVIGERRILNYFIQDPTTGIDRSIAPREHPLFAPIHYSVVFRNPALAEDFNAGLAAIKASGLYDAIMQKY